VRVEWLPTAPALSRTRPGDLEVRGEPKHFTASKVLCWAPPRAAPTSPPNAATTNAPSNGGRADKIKAEVLGNDSAV
jgi:hypothetical protein